MNPIWAAFIGVGISVAHRLQLRVASSIAAGEERVRWVSWLREAWDETQFAMDFSFQAKGMRDPAEFGDALNSMLSPFAEWPDKSTGDHITIVKASSE